MCWIGQPKNSLADIMTKDVWVFRAPEPSSEAEPGYTDAIQLNLPLDNLHAFTPRGKYNSVQQAKPFTVQKKNAVLSLITSATYWWSEISFNKPRVLSLAVALAAGPFTVQLQGSAAIRV